MYRALLAAALVLLASPALADAVTYTGTLGKTSIVLELTSDPASTETPFAGRYFYASKGIDIPLDGVSAKGSKLTLNEEGICTETTCANDNDGYTIKFPISAKWTLTTSADGKTLSGTWTAKGKSLPIALTKVGTRTLPDSTEMTPAGLGAIVSDFAMNQDIVISTQTSPYDFLRMDVPPIKSDPTTFDGSTFQYLSDPRTKFPFPTIVSLKDGSDPTAANAVLRNIHWSLNADAFDCETHQYAGSGWWNPMANYPSGTYGDYTENEFNEVLGLTPKILSWLDSGSTDCGYAHPNNHATYHNLDIPTGTPLDLSKIFAGWSQPGDAGGPSKALADFVRSHLKDADINLAEPGDCDYDSLVGTNLAVAFKPDNKVLLALDGLDYAIMACGADLWEGPITELKPYLASTAADYFPVLKN
jgi:hypothetical protein